MEALLGKYQLLFGHLELSQETGRREEPEIWVECFQLDYEWDLFYAQTRF